MSYLLDTNAVSAILKGKPEPLRNRYDSEKSSGGVFKLSVVVYHELYFGALRSAKPNISLKRLELLPLEMGEPIEFTPEDARIAGEIRAKLAQIGRLIGPYDTLIAAQGLRLRATVVTSNVREFSRVEGLKWEDWAGV